MEELPERSRVPVYQLMADLVWQASLSTKSSGSTYQPPVCVYCVVQYLLTVC